MQQRPRGLQSSKYLLEKFAGLEVAPAQSSAAHRGTMGAPRDAAFSSSHIDQHEKTGEIHCNDIFYFTQSKIFSLQHLINLNMMEGLPRRCSR